MEPDKDRCHRPSAFDKMEGLVREMQDEDNGVPVRSQKLFLSSIPAAFMGYDLIEWLMDRLNIEESEALNIANQLCQYGYFFPISDSKNLVVKDDSTLYRFQSPYYWPWQNRPPDNVEYAIYLAKRTLRNKQRHGLEDYELEALGNLRKNLANKWEFITMQAEEQVKLSKALKKVDKIVSDSQERAYWRVHRPPPGMVSSLEQCPVPNRCRNGSRTRKRTLEDSKREVDLLKNSLTRTRVKMSQALEGMVQYVETYSEYDPLIVGTQPSNPWVTEDLTFWQLNGPLVEAPTEKRVRRWGLSMEELVSDLTGLQEFTNYLRKEYSHENIRFWMAVNDLRRSAQSQIQRKVSEIFEEFLAPGAPCEINIDGKTMEKVHQEMKSPSRFTFDAAQEHVYTLLLKKDCYPRFIRSEHYKNLLATGIQPSQKKRFFVFGPPKKKTSTSSAPNAGSLQQQLTQGGGQGVGGGGGSGTASGPLNKRRGSDRSLSGSAHELAVSGVRDNRVPHSHSQSNLSDIPYRVKKTTPASGIPAVAASTSEDVCPWESGGCPVGSGGGGGVGSGGVEQRSRKNSIQLDSAESSSSDLSAAIILRSGIAVVAEDLTTATTSSASAASASAYARKKGQHLMQQNTLDCGKSSRRLSTGTGLEPRRASVSVLPVGFDGSTATVANTAPQLSFDDTSGVLSVPTTSSDNKDEKTLKSSSSSINNNNKMAPTISVSSVPDDNKQETTTTAVCGGAEEASDCGGRHDRTSDEEPDELRYLRKNLEEISLGSSASASAVGGQSVVVQNQSMLVAMAPLAEPDSESPVSEHPPSECAAMLDEAPDEASGIAKTETLSEEEDAKTAKNTKNDICPWEDAEAKDNVQDGSFRKTYTTLGFL